jgi:hypothetical protein
MNNAKLMQLGLIVSRCLCDASMRCMEAIQLRTSCSCNVAHDLDLYQWSTSVKSQSVGRASDGLKAVKSISRDDDQSGQSGWMFAQMQTPIPWISFTSRHVVDGAGRRDLRSVAIVVALATWHGRGSLITSSAYYCEAEPTWLQCMLGWMGQASPWSHAHRSTCWEPVRSTGGLRPLCFLQRSDECSEYLHQKRKRRLRPMRVCLSCEMDVP